MRWVSVRKIKAVPSRVFHVVSDPEEFQKAIPGGISVEYLTNIRSGVGTRFRAKRMSRGKPMPFDQEIVEFVPDQLVRMINVTHGTTWDSTFTVKPDGRETIVTLEMESKTNNLFAKAMNRLISGMLKKALDKDTDSVKAYCER